jgi:AcrR family transcriptional regulator
MTRVTTKKAATTLPSERRTHLVVLAGELFAEKGFRATTVREIADAAGILSGSLYHHFDSKESIGDEILSGFLNDVLTGYRAAVAAHDDPRAAIEEIVRSSATTLARHRAALTMLQRDWSYFSGQPRFDYLRKAMREIERTWITQLERGKEAGLFRADLDAKLTYRLLRDILWMPTSWPQGGAAGWTTGQVVDGLLRLIFDGITTPDARPTAAKAKARAVPAKAIGAPPKAAAVPAKTTRRRAPKLA